MRRFLNRLARRSDSSTHSTVKRPRAAPPSLGLEILESRVLLSLNPTPAEQAMLEDVNRMRTHPEDELDVIFRLTRPLISDDTHVQSAVKFFDIDADTLIRQWSELEPAPPLAWSEELTNAAEFHNQQMIAADEQAHVIGDELDIGERAQEFGFEYLSVGENVYAFGKSLLHAHAGFVVDWGDTESGIQDPPGHRINMMKPQFAEVGIKITPENNDDTKVGPLVITQDFGLRRDYQPFLLGVVYSDTDEDEMFDAGEGLGGVQITVRGGGQTYQTTSMPAGGYQLSLPNGVYSVTAEGGRLTEPLAASTVVMEGVNVKVDFSPQYSIRPPTAVDDMATTTEDVPVHVDVVSNDTAPDGTVDASRLQITQSPSHGIAQLTDDVGTIRYQPFSDYAGTDSFRYVVYDLDGAVSNEGTVTVRVGSVNDAPNARNDSYTTNEDVAKELDVLRNDVDVDGSIDPNTFRIVGLPRHGKAQYNRDTGTIRYVPDPNYSGDDTFRYTVRDTDGTASNTATVRINVRPVNDPPRAVSDELVAVQGRPVSFSVTSNDDDVDGSVVPATVMIATNANHGTVHVDARRGMIDYVPDDDFFGVDTFRYTVRDNSNATSNAAQVRIIVTQTGFPWRNPLLHADTNNDGTVTPRDALQVIEDLGRRLPSSPSNSTSRRSFVDLNGDGVVSPRDALGVIQDLIARQASAAPLSAVEQHRITVSDGEEMIVEPVAVLPTELDSPSNSGQSMVRNDATSIAQNDDTTSHASQAIGSFIVTNDDRSYEKRTAFLESPQGSTMTKSPRRFEMSCDHVFASFESIVS